VCIFQRQCVRRIAFYPKAYFNPQYAGFGEKNKGFSLAFSLEEPTIAETKQEINGITFFIESNDSWFFEDKNVNIQFSEDKKEVFTTYS
jgi:uncharacterized protein YneR